MCPARDWRRSVRNSPSAIPSRPAGHYNDRGHFVIVITAIILLVIPIALPFARSLNSPNHRTSGHSGTSTPAAAGASTDSQQYHHPKGAASKPAKLSLDTASAAAADQSTSGKAAVTMQAAAAAAAVSPGATPAPPSVGYFVAPARPRIVLFGDSLTERGFEVPGGWASALAQNYTRRADVVNRGLSGYNTRWAVHTLPHVFGPAAAPQPAAIATEPAADGTAVANGTGEGKGGGSDEDGSAPPAGAATGPGHVLFATLFFGANDAARLEGPTHSARQHVPLPEYEANLRAMVDYMRRVGGVRRILLITPPPVWGPGRKKHQIWRMGEQSADWPLDRTLEATAPYAATAAAVAADLGLPCLDLFNLLQKEEQWGERLLCDGLHFTAAGQERVWALIKQLLDDTWPDIRPELMPVQFPLWDSVNRDNVAESFTPGVHNT